MVAGGALAESLHGYHLGLTSKGHHVLEEDCLQHHPKTTHVAKSLTNSRSATSFNAAAGPKPGPAHEGKEGQEGGVGKRMGRTEDEAPCECTDPLKTKKHGGPLGSGVLSGGLNRDHEAVMEKFKKEQRAAERKNANAIMRAPHSQFLKAKRKLEKEIENITEEYAHFRHLHDEYTVAFNEAMRAMKWHCGGIRSIYKGIRFDCERERLEAQNQFFSRRHVAECLIGKRTPYDVIDGTNSVQAAMKKIGAVPSLHMSLPPEVAMVLGSKFLTTGLPDGTPVSSQMVPEPSARVETRSARTEHGSSGQVRRDVAALVAFL